MNSIRNLLNPTSFQSPQAPQMPGILGNISALFGKFRQFSQNPIGAIMSMKNVNVPQGFNGSPEELAKYLLSSGQMSQQQFEQFAQIANNTPFPKR